MRESIFTMGCKFDLRAATLRTQVVNEQAIVATL